MWLRERKPFLQQISFLIKLNFLCASVLRKKEKRKTAPQISEFQSKTGLKPKPHEIQIIKLNFSSSDQDKLMLHGHN